MVRARNAQSVVEFRTNAAQTLDRLNRTGDAEVLTEGGRDRAVLLSPKAFDALAAAAEFAHTLATIQQAEAEAAAGAGRPAAAFLDELRDKLLSKKAEQA